MNDYPKTSKKFQVQFVDEEDCFHRCISLLKRWILGTLQGSVGKDHIQDYLNEFTFRFNRRSSTFRGMLFWRLVQMAVTHEASTLHEITNHQMQQGRKIGHPNFVPQLFLLLMVIILGDLQCQTQLAKYLWQICHIDLIYIQNRALKNQLSIFEIYFYKRQCLLAHLPLIVAYMLISNH